MDNLPQARNRSSGRDARAPRRRPRNQRGVGRHDTQPVREFPAWLPLYAEPFGSTGARFPGALPGGFDPYRPLRILMVR